MQITSHPEDWTPIDPNLENELSNAYERIAKLEKYTQDMQALMKYMAKTMNTLNGEPIYEVRFYEGRCLRAELIRHLIQATSEDKNKSVQDALTQQMRAIVKQTIMEQQRPGGLLRK